MTEQQLGAAVAAATNTSTSVDGEVALFSGTGGKTLKRSTGKGIPLLTSGVQSNAAAGTDYVAPGGALGTPSSGTLTNCTGLPVAGIAASTSTAVGVGSVELGHASDTTISRSSAGVIAVEGVTVPLNSTSSTHTASTIELGNASDTTLSRTAAGYLGVEGNVQRRQVKRGIATGSGSTLYSIPGMGIITQVPYALSPNVDYLFPFYVYYPITITDWAWEVTTGPASNANVRTGIYLADSNLQPSGNPLYDSGGTAVASAFTGKKSASSLSVALAPGAYLSILTMDVSMNMRGQQCMAQALPLALGAAMVYGLLVARTYAAFTSPGTAWTTAGTTAAGWLPPTVWKWTE